MKRLSNLLKFGKISLPDKDQDLYPRTQVEYYNKVKSIMNLFPYGISANPPRNSLSVLMSMQGKEENIVGIPTMPDKRFKGLSEAEVKIGNFLSNASVYFRNDGVSEINGSEFEGLVKIIDLTTKLNALVTDYNLHTHSGVQTGGGISGVPTSTTNTFSKSDYENVNVVHGKEGTGTSGSSGGSIGATLDHSALINLDYASAGHTGFEKSLTFSTGLIRAGDTISINNSQINHDALLNFVAGEHFLQSAINQISSSVANGILTTTNGALGSITDNSTNWNTAYSWGDHSVEGYLKNIVEDTTPQLGANLDAQEFAINNVGDITHDDATASDWELINANTDKDLKLCVSPSGTKLCSIVMRGTNGWVGVNTAGLAPDAVFQVQNEGAAATIQARTYADNPNANSSWTSIKIRGTASSPSAVLNNDKLGRFIFSGYDGSAFFAGCRIETRVDGTPAAGSIPGRFEFQTTPVGGGTPLGRFYIRENGLLELIQTAGEEGAATFKFEEKDTTPANPTSGTEVKMYMKSDKLVIQFNDAGTIKYFYLNLTATTDQSLIYTTTAP